MRTVAVLSLCLVLAFASSARAGTTGQISGAMHDSKSGLPLVGSIVQVEGTKYGAIADQEGKYFILNLPPGDYKLVAHAIGYRDQAVKGVHVTADFTTAINFDLEETLAGTTEAVQVEGKRPLIQKDADEHGPDRRRGDDPAQSLARLPRHRRPEYGRRQLRELQLPQVIGPRSRRWSAPIPRCSSSAAAGRTRSATTWTASASKTS